MEQYFAVAAWWNYTPAEQQSAVLQVLGFLPSGLYWSKIPKSCSQAWPLPMVKATLWKCQKQLCESPVLKWCPCTTLTASATHAHRAARTLGDAENLLLLLELSHRSSGTATVMLTVCRGTAAPGLLACSTCCIWLVLMWKQKPSEQYPFAILQQEASLHCGCSAFLKNKCTSGKVHTQTCTFFLSQGLWMFSSPIDVTLCLVLFGKSLRTRIVRYN